MSLEFLQFSKVTFIDLTYQNIGKLPEPFGNLHSLQKLYISGNQLPSLPESFVNLTSLKVLMLIIIDCQHYPKHLVI